MKSAILLVFALIVVYTGILTFRTDSTAGIALMVVGAVLIINPILYFIRYFGLMPAPRLAAKPGAKRRKSHLKIVKSDDDRRPPTIH